MITKVVVFDFDSTMCYTPEPGEGRKIWLDRTGMNFPHPTGWWSKPESLDTEIYYIPLNEWVYKKYLEAMADTTCYVVLATGRLDRLRKAVEKVLNFHNLSFDEVLLNNGGDTYSFKIREFERLISDHPNIKEFVIFDDRHEHLCKFVEWSKTQPVGNISIIDVVKKVVR